ELGQRLLFFLLNTETSEPKIDKPVILMVRELTATVLAALPKDKLLAVVSLEGAANSHAAILSRALGIPAVMGVSVNLRELNTKQGIVDGYRGQLFIAPSKTILHEYRTLVSEERELARMVNEAIREPALTLDGARIELLLNAGLNADTSSVINQGVDGVGLYRTEISFLLQHRFPSEQEQTQQYRQVLNMYPHQSVVMRTLDIGGDKPLPYLPIEEDNPFLGWRGIRFTLDHPDIFIIQLRSMIKASAESGNLSILLPMISGAKDLDDALKFIYQAYQEVSQLDPRVVMPKIGIMLEVPSMLYLLPLIADKIDFVSVGSNDLTQYLLAVDRNNARVADVYESMHPAVVMALKQIQVTCATHRIPVCVCGELAGDPIGALLLIGLGYTTLSMNASNIAKVKYLVRHSQLSDLEHLAEQALNQPYGRTIYNMMLSYIEQQGFADFMRVGKQ
ncbi:MAG: phosphoenolpyruvate--protein phosphotransferase, partial [Vibrio sp.]